MFGYFNGMGAVTLTVTPAATSNTYMGNITLNVTGLTNTEKVILQKFLDLNGNGVPDAGEPLMDSFKITDNDLTGVVINGVTNINLPFDRNTTGSAITVTLSLSPPVALENAVGSFIYQLSSPGGHFSTITTTFMVTNAATAQYVSGTVFSNGVAPLPNAIVVAIGQTSSGYAGGAVADAAGHYLLNLNPGTYSLIATAPNYYYDQALAPLVTITNGISATNDLSLTNGTDVISGNVHDAATTNTLAGVMLQLSSGNFFAIAFTDTNGNYSAAVTPNFWKIKPIQERLPRRGYISPQGNLQVNASGGVTNAYIALSRGDTFFYGRITDSLGVPFANVEFDASDTNGFYDSKGISDTNGYYVIAVLGNTNVWNGGPNSAVNTVLANYIVNAFDETNIFAGQNVLQNYVALPITAHISGQVKDNSGTPVSGVSLYADQFISGTRYQSVNGQVDGSGNYSLGVASGPWQVFFSFGGNNDLPSHGLEDLFEPYNVNIPPTNVTLNITVYPTGTAVLTQPNHISPTQFGFNIVGSVGVSYTVLASTNLASTNWSPIFTLQLTNSPFPIVDTQATNRSRFYRVQKN